MIDAGFIPILFKQIPFAVGQFTVNEFMHELGSSSFAVAVICLDGRGHAVDRNMAEKTRQNLSSLSNQGITLGCGGMYPPTLCCFPQLKDIG